MHSLLSSQTDLFQMIFEQSPQSFQLVDRSGKTLLVNKAWKELWKVDDEFVNAFIYKSHNIFEDPQVKQSGVLVAIEKAFKGDHSETPAIYYDPAVANNPGRPRWASALIFPVRNERNEVSQIVLMHRDITEAKRSEDESRLLTSISRVFNESLDYKDTIQKVAKALIPTFADGCMIDVIEGNDINEIAVAHILPEKEILLLNLREKYRPYKGSPQPAGRVWHSEKAELLTELSDDIVRHHVTDEEHYELINSICMKSHIAVPLFFKGKIFGIMCLFITEGGRRYDKNHLEYAIEVGRRAELALAHSRLYRDAQEAIVVRDEFISVASHELRTPLTAAMLHMQIATISPKADIALNEGVRLHLAGADRCLRILLRLMNQIFDVARISSGMAEYHFERTNLSQLVSLVCERFAILDSNKITLEIEPNIFVICDPAGIDQVISNVIGNAKKFAPGTEIKVKVTGIADGAKIFICDKGPGIPKDLQEKVFEKFVRFPTKLAVAGLGIGLYLCKQIIEAHNGSISVESNSGDGTQFIIKIPNGA